MNTDVATKGGPPVLLHAPHAHGGRSHRTDSSLLEMKFNRDPEGGQHAVRLTSRSIYMPFTGPAHAVPMATDQSRQHEMTV